MKSFRLLFCCLAALATVPSFGWLGIKAKTVPASPQAGHKPSGPDVGRSETGKKADTAYLARKVQNIPTGAQGAYLGSLQGVRCFNCTPDMVQVNLADTVTGETGVLALRIEVWNAIERPVKDRRMYDFHNRCFYFGHKEVDTAFVGGEWTEIRVRELPCYPYMQRTHPPKALTVSAPAPRALSAIAPAATTAAATDSTASTAVPPVAATAVPIATLPPDPIATSPAAPFSAGAPAIQPQSAPARAPSVLRSDLIEAE
jgi:hypothetical protein